MQKRSREQPSHSIKISNGTLLNRLVGTDTLETNSLHHQAVAECSKSLAVCALAEDGVIEALEAPDKRFYLGVQWHPEHLEGYASDVLFAAFCVAAGRAHG